MAPSIHALRQAHARAVRSWPGGSDQTKPRTLYPSYPQPYGSGFSTDVKWNFAILSGPAPRSSPLFLSHRRKSLKTNPKNPTPVLQIISRLRRTISPMITNPTRGEASSACAQVRSAHANEAGSRPSGVQSGTHGAQFAARKMNNNVSFSSYVCRTALANSFEINAALLDAPSKIAKNSSYKCAF